MTTPCRAIHLAQIAAAKQHPAVYTEQWLGLSEGWGCSSWAGGHKGCQRRTLWASRPVEQKQTPPAWLPPCLPFSVPLSLPLFLFSSHVRAHIKASPNCCCYAIPHRLVEKATKVAPGPLSNGESCPWYSLLGIWLLELSQAYSEIFRPLWRYG